MNLPMPAGCGDAEYAAVYREIVLPIARRFDPQLVIASAGFDAAAGDPLAGMSVSPAGFRALTDVCVAAASGAGQGRVVAVLEGGYDEDGLASGARALVGRLLETDPPLAGAARTSPGAAALVASFRRGSPTALAGAAGLTAVERCVSRGRAPAPRVLNCLVFGRSGSP